MLTPNGRVCIAIVHPIASAGRFESRTPEAAFRITGSYLQPRRYADVVERDGLRMTFSSIHRPLGAYAAELEASGFVIERIVEVHDPNDPPGDRWQRLPLFLHLRAARRPAPGA